MATTEQSRRETMDQAAVAKLHSIVHVRVPAALDAAGPGLFANVIRLVKPTGFVAGHMMASASDALVLAVYGNIRIAEDDPLWLLRGACGTSNLKGIANERAIADAETCIDKFLALKT